MLGKHGFQDPATGDKWLSNSSYDDPVNGIKKTLFTLANGSQHKR